MFNVNQANRIAMMSGLGFLVFLNFKYGRIFSFFIPLVPSYSMLTTGMPVISSILGDIASVTRDGQQ